MSEARQYAIDAARATTEFGSKQFHDKIDQQKHKTHQNESHHDPSGSGSRFILPLREAKVADVEVKPNDHKKSRGFFKLRHKVSRLHSKPVQPTVEHIEPVRSSVESTRRRYSTAQSSNLPVVAGLTLNSIPLDQLVATLPAELQIQIILELSLPDVLNLRSTSKLWHALITANETPIVRHHLKYSIPAYAQRLFPATKPEDFNFHYLCGLWHRLHVAAKLAYLLCEWVTKDIFLRQTDADRLAFAPQRERMRRRLIPLLFTVFHFFETYRKLHLEYLEKYGHQGLKREPYTLNPIEKQIMDMYDDQTLLRVHEVFPLVIASFCRRLRPPTYVGRVERSLRGYLREKPSDDVHVAILCLGGLRQVEHLWEIKGYNTRRAAVDTWFNSLTKDASPEHTTTKTKRSLMSFGRKKSTSGADREQHHHYPSRDQRSSFSSLHRTKSSTGSIGGNDPGADPNWIFNTSLSHGIPMGALDHDQAHLLLNDLPVLQQIWTVTAESLILKRGIVGRAQDIRRNQQLMLDLIKEDGLDEEDEWCYGRNVSPSMRQQHGTPDDEAD
jgi:hypothetical protein